MSGVKYWVIHKCMNCQTSNLKDATSCAMCGFLFTGEATDEELRESNKKYEMKNKPVEKEE